MTTLTITPTGTVNSAVSEHANLVEARRALVAYADSRGARINTSTSSSGTLSYAPYGNTHQATHTWWIDDPAERETRVSKLFADQAASNRVRAELGLD
jgi:hypothetical protein